SAQQQQARRKWRRDRRYWVMGDDCLRTDAMPGAAPARMEDRIAAAAIHIWLELPQLVTVAAQEVDGKRPVPGQFHRRHGDLSSRLHDRGDGGLDVLHQPVG